MPVSIAMYEPGWAAKFEEERTALLSLLADRVTGGIHHVGSTSVPGLDAKPVIDILVGVEDQAEFIRSTRSTSAIRSGSSAAPPS